MYVRPISDTSKFSVGIPEERDEKFSIFKDYGEPTEKNITEELLPLTDNNAKTIVEIMSDMQIENDRLNGKVQRLQETIDDSISSSAFVTTVIGDMPVDSSSIRKLNDEIISLKKALAKNGTKNGGWSKKDRERER